MSYGAGASGAAGAAGADGAAAAGGAADPGTDGTPPVLGGLIFGFAEFGIGNPVPGALPVGATDC